MAEREDTGDAYRAHADGSGGPAVTPAEISQLIDYADAQERKVAQLTQTVSDLQHALDSRVVVERAIGMLAERFNLAISDAWELLRAAARNSRQRVKELATEVTEERGRTPDEVMEAARRRA